jgi:DNA topoisomerase-2
MNISEFYNNEYIQYALYDNYRKCASHVDGLKPSARKVLHTIAKYNVTSPLKVAQLSSKVAESTQYLHGEVSLVGVIVGLAQTFVGSNNLNLLEPDGSFGKRFTPEAAAARYIYTMKSKFFDLVFNKEDYDICLKQTFEGDEIEPKQMLPIIPLSLVNGSEGIGNGYAQRILPRNPSEIIALVAGKLTGKTMPMPKPWYNGFDGRVESDGENRWVFYGNFSRPNSARITITELPIGYDLDGYLEVLNDLEESETIKSYRDLSEDDKFKFEIQATRELVSKSDDELYDILKLKKSVVENFTCVNQDNGVVEHASADDLFNEFYAERHKFYQLRKKHNIDQMKSNLLMLCNKLKFIRMILAGTLNIMNRKKSDIESELTTLNFNKFEDSWKYLFDMSIISVSEDLVVELSNKLNAKHVEMKDYASKTVEDLWLADLSKLKKALP